MAGKSSKLLDIAHIMPLLFGLTLASPALAEVSDKEPGTIQTWLIVTGICAIAFLAATIRPWFALLLLPISSLFALGLIDELHDPAIGPAIRQELGETYIWQSYVATAIAFIGPIAAWTMLRVMKGRHTH